MVWRTTSVTRPFGFNGSFPKACQQVVRGILDGDEIDFDRIELPNVADVIGFKECPARYFARV